LRFRGEFDNNRVEDRDLLTDGFQIRAIDDNNNLHVISTGGGGSDSPDVVDDGMDTYVTAGETSMTTANGVGQVMVPHIGNHMCRMSLEKSKNYNAISGTGKPRTDINPYREGNPSPGQEASYGIGFDKEAFIGWTIQLPSNMEIDDHGAGNQTTVFGINTDPGRTLFAMRFGNAPTNNPAIYWSMIRHFSDQSVEEDHASSVKTIERISIGGVDQLLSLDVGESVSFVLRYRWNPFDVDTNPVSAGIPNSLNQLFEANKGILQLFKTESSDTPDGDGFRQPKLTNLNFLNEGVGLVPNNDMPKWRAQLYKFNWDAVGSTGGTRASNSTIQNIYWSGFYGGEAINNGTKFEDCNPGRYPMPI